MLFPFGYAYLPYIHTQPLVVIFDSCCGACFVCAVAPVAQAVSLELLKTIRDSATIEVVDREFDRDFVAGKNLDVMHPHLTADVSQDLVAVLKLNRKHCIRKGIKDGTFEFDNIFFGQKCSSNQKLA